MSEHFESQEVHEVTSLPPAEDFLPEPTKFTLQPGEILVGEGNQAYSITDGAAPGAFNEVPIIRRKVIAARLRAAADLIEGV